MALSAHQPQQPNHRSINEEMPTSWRKKNISQKRHSSAPSRQRMTASTTAAAVPGAQQSPLLHHHQHENQHENPTAPRHNESAVATPLADTSTPAGGDSGGGGGPLSFPKPKFSAALKVVEDGGFTLVSRATGRRWMAVNSSRECQFGEVLRAVELTEDATAPSAYFAIKVESTRYSCRVPLLGIIQLIYRSSKYFCYLFSTHVCTCLLFCFYVCTVVGVLGAVCPLTCATTRGVCVFVEILRAVFGAPPHLFFSSTHGVRPH